MREHRREGLVEEDGYRAGRDLIVNDADRLICCWGTETIQRMKSYVCGDGDIKSKSKRVSQLRSKFCWS